PDDRGELAVDAGGDHDRAQPAGLFRVADPAGDLAGPLHAVHERDALGGEGGVAELRQEAVADGFGGDSGAVGDVEDRARARHAYFLLAAGAAAGWLAKIAVPAVRRRRP